MKKRAMILMLPIILGWGCEKKFNTPSSGTANPIRTSANNGTFTLSCEAVCPDTVNNAVITLACPTPMNLSAVKSADNVVIYSCAYPAQLPQRFNNSSVSLISSSICSSSTICVSTSGCSGSNNNGSLVLGCGSTLPCSANNAVITITCPTLTDLSAIQYADNADIVSCVVPCKLPQRFDNGSLTIDPSVSSGP